MIIPSLEGLTLTKGNVGGSDAIIFPDLNGSREVRPEQIAMICDRRLGIGADCLMRIVRTETEAGWRIDAWNSAGRPLVHAGPFARLAAHYLRVSGLIELFDGESVAFDGPEGPLYVTRTGLHYSTGYELALPVSEESVSRGYDVAVSLDGVKGVRGGLMVRSSDFGVVVALEKDEEMSAVTGQAQYDPNVPGARLTVVVPQGDAMFTDFDGVERPFSAFAARVFGEGPAVEQGARDAAVALHAWAGETATGIYRADVAGTGLEIRFAGGEIEMTGPAEIVAEFSLTGIAGEGR